MGGNTAPGALERIKEVVNWILNQNTCAEGLQGIYSAIKGETPCATRYLKAVAVDGSTVASVSWETLGNEYRYAQKRFGDQLESAGFERMGY